MADLYDALDIDRSASTADVRRAYRKAAKSAHPDAGGSEAEFERLHTAMVVLSDPQRRRRYDETGEVDTAPDIHFSQLMEQASVIIDLTLGHIAKSGRKAEATDFMAGMKDVIRGLKQKMSDEIRDLDHAKTLYETIRGRFSAKKEGVPNHVENLISGKLSQIAMMVAKKNLDIERLVEVDDLLQGFSYRQDAPPPGSAAQDKQNQMAAMMQRALGIGMVRGTGF